MRENKKLGGRKWSFPDFEISIRRLPGGTEDIPKNSQDNVCPGPRSELIIS
jgi:hypothetical protein